MLLLDSDVVIDVLRGYLPAIRWLQSLAADEELGLSGFAMLELIEGCENKQAMQRLQRHVRHYRAIPGLVTEQPYQRI